MNKIIASIAFLSTIVGANWALATFGIVPLLGTSMMVPAGVYFAGLAFGLRDAVQELGGRTWTVGLIVVGAGLSWFIEPTFAIASGTAFLLSELADFAIYTPLRERQWVGAVIASNLVGAVVDSLLFLWLAFGSIQFWQSNTIGKALMTVPAIGIVWFARSRRSVA